jgi:uncharacterized membrane protein YgaE (UPF0421/DUF939 family)
LKKIETIMLRNESYLPTTVKVALFSMLAILLADILGFRYAPSAGIITILSIQATKKETLSLAFGRFLAFIGALMISYVCFQLLGFTYAAFALYLFFFILLCLNMNWRNAIAVDSVLILHFLAEKSMELADIGNELGLFLLGVGFGMLANIHLRNDKRAMELLEDNIDEEMRRILNQMADCVIQETYRKRDSSVLKLMDLLYQAESLARQNVNNQFRKANYYDLHYIQMRKDQAEVLSEMEKITHTLRTRPKQAETIAELLRSISLQFHRENTAESLTRDFESVKQLLKQEKLPVDREEFEDRAMLFALTQKIEEFLRIKKRFAEQYDKKEKEKRR